MDGKVKENLETIRATREHLREVDRNSILDKIQSKHYVTELGIRDRIIPMDGSEKAIFPLDNLPQVRVENFTGRGEDIDRLHKWLGTPEPFSIRKYHIYGRRGIGTLAINSPSDLYAKLRRENMGCNGVCPAIPKALRRNILGPMRDQSFSTTEFR